MPKFSRSRYHVNTTSMSATGTSRYRFFVISTLNLLLICENKVVFAESTMEKFAVVPDVIDNKPGAVLNVTYSENAKVNMGNELTPASVKNAPVVNWPAQDSDFYVLIMTDPDAPSRQNPKFREWHHWLVGNIPGNKVEQGEVLSQYVGAGPPKDTGLHRYVLLVFKQPQKLQFDEQRLSNTSGQGRGKFSTKAFAKKYNLADAVAGNFFQAKWDSYVPTLQKQLSGK